MSIFHKGRKAHSEPELLHIAGVREAPITPGPDDAEIAAQALMEILLEKQKHKRKPKKPNEEVRSEEKQSDTSSKQKEKFHDKSYYEHLAERIKKAHIEARKRTLRFVSFVEQELQKPNLPATGEGSLALLETELYKRIDTIDREQGELKERWQNCLAEVTLRQMEAEEKQKTENEKRNEQEYNEQQDTQA